MTIDLDNIVKVANSHSPNVVNEYLELGWILLQVSPSELGPMYALGWDKSNGEVKELPKFEDEYDLPY